MLNVVLFDDVFVQSGSCILNIILYWDVCVQSGSCILNIILCSDDNSDHSTSASTNTVVLLGGGYGKVICIVF